MSIVFGLEVQGTAKEFPLVVGCSLLTRSGEGVDIPHRWIRTPGKALWGVKFPAEFVTNPGVTPVNDRKMAGRIIFALWRDDKFRERLADTSWVNWDAYWLIGSSTAGMDMQDERIKNEYGGMDDAWIVSKSKHLDNDPLGIR